MPYSNKYLAMSQAVWVLSTPTIHGMVRCTKPVATCSGLFMLILPFEGTNNVAKEMKKITDGLVRNRGVTWFPELVDKRK